MPYLLGSGAAGAQHIVTLGQRPRPSAGGYLGALFPVACSYGGTDQHPVSIGTASIWLDPTRDAVALTPPTTATPAPNLSSRHVFAVIDVPKAAQRAGQHAWVFKIDWR